MLKKAPTEIKTEKGFTLIELLISITVFLIAIAAIYGVSRIAAIQKNTANTRVDQLRSARIALEYIRRDTMNAGFGYHRTGGNMPDNTGNKLFGLPADADGERDLLTAIIAGNNITTNSLNSGGKMDNIAFVSRDQTFNEGALVTYTGSAGSGTNVNVTTTVNGTQNCRVFDLYLFESVSGTTQAVGIVTAIPNGNTIRLTPGTGDPLGVNQPANGTGNNQSLLVTTAGGGTIKKINLVGYSITENGVLVRKSFGNRTGMTAAEQIETRELVYGVSDFQIKYFMDDGTTVDDPSNGNNGRINQMNMNRVVQIQVSITLAEADDGLPQSTSPITIREFISTKNLRYEAS